MSARASRSGGNTERGFQIQKFELPKLYHSVQPWGNLRGHTKVHEGA